MVLEERRCRCSRRSFDNSQKMEKDIFLGNPVEKKKKKGFSPLILQYEIIEGLNLKTIFWRQILQRYPNLRISWIIIRWSTTFFQSNRVGYINIKKSTVLSTTNFKLCKSFLLISRIYLRWLEWNLVNTYYKELYNNGSNVGIWSALKL